MKILSFLFSLLLVSTVQAQLVEIPTPRGIAALHCAGIPQARTACNQIVQILYQSRISKPAINYLVDGSFGLDVNAMIQDINYLTSDGRQLTLILYLLNGAGQRSCRHPYHTGWSINICPADFNFKMHYNIDNIHQEFLDKVIVPLIPVVQYAKSRNARVILVPQLEDNLDILTFEFLVILSKYYFPDVEYMRNPGHLSDRIVGGYKKEIHPNSSSFTVRNGFVTNDGASYNFPGARGDRYPKRVSVKSLKKMRNKATTLNDIFIVWKGDMQGTPNSGKKPAARRTYRIPNANESWFLTSFLWGL